MMEYDLASALTVGTAETMETQLMPSDPLLRVATSPAKSSKYLPDRAGGNDHYSRFDGGTRVAGCVSRRGSRSISYVLPFGDTWRFYITRNVVRQGQGLRFRRCC